MIVDYEEIGQNVKMFRARRRLKQAELAELVEVSAQHISHIECGRTKLSLPVLIQLSEALSVDLYDLLGSNIHPRPILEMEYTEILTGATQEQRTLCLELCRTVIEHGTGSHSM